MVAYASYSVLKYKLHRKIDIDSAFSVIELPEKPEEKHKNCFQLVNSDKSFEVYAQDKVTKEEWVRDLKKCVEDLKTKIKKEKVSVT